LRPTARSSCSPCAGSCSPRASPTADGKQHRFVLRYKGGWQTGTVRKNLLIETDDPQQAELRVSLMANVLSASAN
jgi:hypothetical protein